VRYQTFRSVSDVHVFVLCYDGTFYDAVPEDDPFGRRRLALRILEALRETQRVVAATMRISRSLSLRVASGRVRRSRPLSSSRSKPQTQRPSVRLRISAKKSGIPSASQATSSPSITAEGAGRLGTASRIDVKRSVWFLQLRENRQTSPPALRNASPEPAGACSRHLRLRRRRSGAEKIVIEDAKTNARHRCAEDHQDIEVVPGKNLQIKNSHAKEAHARRDQNQ
jgi:hypothetical protein